MENYSAASQFFADADWSHPLGRVFVGGQLTTDWLLDAYRHGIFPWPMSATSRRMQWWSLDPRAIFEIDGMHISRRLARRCRGDALTVTHNRDFAAVMRGCGTSQDRARATWISEPLVAAYCQLHQLGHAHSVEVWQAGELVGGTYGVAIGGLFAGESMFYRVRDASKIALVYLHRHLAARGYALFDIQQLTDHTASLGAIEISRRDYYLRLRAALVLPVTFD